MIMLYLRFILVLMNLMLEVKLRNNDISEKTLSRDHQSANRLFVLFRLFGRGWTTKQFRSESTVNHVSETDIEDIDQERSPAKRGKTKSRVRFGRRNEDITWLPRTSTAVSSVKRHQHLRGAVLHYSIWKYKITWVTNHNKRFLLPRQLVLRQAIHQSSWMRT